MTKIALGFVLCLSLGAASAFAGQELPSPYARGVNDAPARQASCTQQTQSWLSGLFGRTKEPDASCVAPSASAAAAPLILGTGY